MVGRSSVSDQRTSSSQSFGNDGSILDSWAKRDHNSNQGERPHLRHQGSELGAFFVSGGTRMAVAVRRTDEGFAITPRGVAMAVGILTILGTLVTVTAAFVGARQQL